MSIKSIPCPIGLMMIGISILLSACLSRQMEPPAPDPTCQGVAIIEGSDNTNEPGIVTTDHRLFYQPCYEKVLSQVLKDAPQKPLVLFVHGRGEHPSKLVEDKLLEGLEKYDVLPIGFTWPSWCKSWCFPEENAYQSADELAVLLKVLEGIRANEVGNRPYTILTHSMGSLVLSKIEPLPRFIDHVVISASASAHQGHSQWIDQIGLGKRIYVVANQPDSTLRRLEGNGIGSLFFDETDRLGRWAVERATPQNIGQRALYFGFKGRLGNKHRYYINQQGIVGAFYQSVLTGQQPNFLEFEEVIPGRVYVPRAN